VKNSSIVERKFRDSLSRICVRSFDLLPRTTCSARFCYSSFLYSYVIFNCVFDFWNKHSMVELRWGAKGIPYWSTEVAMRLRAQITLDIDADDYVCAAEHQRLLEVYLEKITERYPTAKLLIRERRERNAMISHEVA
jgi:hypothetical protein